MEEDNLYFEFIITPLLLKHFPDIKDNLIEICTNELFTKHNLQRDEYEMILEATDIPYFKQINVKGTFKKRCFTDLVVIKNPSQQRGASKESLS